MKCPTCPDATLVMTERQGVEIDYCPSCRGVWLDRGELDKLIERSTALTAPAPAPAPMPQPQGQRRPDFVDSDYGRHGGHRRKSWLSDIFD
jgi:uncharacterized protein